LLVQHKSPTGVPKVQQVEAASLQRRRHFSLSSAWSPPRAVRFWLALLACLAQLWMPVQHGHAPSFPAHSITYGATGTRLKIVNVDGEQSGVLCPLHGPRASSHDGNAAPPCHNDNRPCCPCPCCAPVSATIGILPQEARAAYEPQFSAAPAPPARLASLARPASFEGQPRAPPILI
jgi:hypothetical protein